MFAPCIPRFDSRALANAQLWHGIVAGGYAVRLAPTHDQQPITSRCHGGGDGGPDGGSNDADALKIKRARPHEFHIVWSGSIWNLT